MFGFLFRVIGVGLLALALVLAVLDVTRSITAGQIVITPLAQSWASVSEGTLLQIKAFLEQSIHPVIWDPIFLFLLTFPSWLLLWLMSMFLLWLGQKRQTPYGRFASR